MSEAILPRGVKNLKGRKFGRLTVVSFLEMQPNGKYKKAVWKCECDCGGEKFASTSTLIQGTQSCGCLKREMTVAKNKANAKHGMSRHPLFAVWNGMLDRCYRKNHRSFKNYGARGITVCDRWRGPDGFFNFIADMGPRPPGRYKFSVERSENGGNYEPTNCHWANKSEQQRNTRVNHNLTFNGKTMCLADLAQEAGLKYLTLLMRLKRGWSAEKAIMTPLRESRFWPI